ncbi:hypothetical protein IFR05_005778 [Cadophora sp. M221]|nr:hypothetical protein IFR05_005778 [Cadophora sp. M221]
MPQLGNANEDDSSGHGSSSRSKKKRNGKSITQYNVPEGNENIELHTGINELMCAIDSAHQANEFVTKLYQRYARDIRDGAENRKRVVELEDLCCNKDSEIKRRKDALEVMLERNEEVKGKLEHGKKILADDKKKFEDMKGEFMRDKQSEEAKARQLEQDRSDQYDIDLKKEVDAMEKSFKDRRENLEKSFKDDREILEKSTKQREESDKKTISDLETKKTALTAELAACKMQFQRQKVELKAVQQKLEKMERLRDVADNEVLRFEKELKRVKNEFTLTAKTPEFYNVGFSEIFSQIASISSRYFANLEVDNLRQVQENVLKVDSCFGSIPFSDSDDSARLREAHAERVMTAQLCAIVWQPFSSEKTLQNPEAATLLGDIATALGASYQGSVDGDRSARVWSTFTTRGLSLLEANKTSFRVERFVEVVLRVLSALVTPLRRTDLEADLSGLAKAAINLWNEAQQDELEISVCQTLDPKCHDQWRSTVFEPEPTRPLSPRDGEEQPTIHLLFPLITAKKHVTTTENQLLVPGSFEDPQTSHRVETINIHPGVGLPESSALVVNGKMEAEKIEGERELEQKLLAESIENAKREFWARKSVRGSISVPSSPIEP